MPNMAFSVTRHNMKMLQDDQQQIVPQPGCNCQGGIAVCPVQGKCKTDCVVCMATVTEMVTGSVETYTGVTSRQFKQRYYEHNADMRKEAGRIKSGLSSHVWNLKDRGVSYDVSWRLKERSTAFNPTTKKCRICLKEKYHILYKRDGASLNKRSEIFNTCRHRRQKLLDNMKT